jgi:hypothetical protein
MHSKADARQQCEFMRLRLDGRRSAPKQPDGQIFAFIVGQITLRTSDILSRRKGRWPSSPFPTDAKLLHAAIKGLNRLARRHGVRLRQSYSRVAKAAAMTQSGIRTWTIGLTRACVNEDAQSGRR